MKKSRVVLILGSVVAIASCTPAGPQSYKIPWLAEVLPPDWTIIPLPNGSFVPGEIVQIQPVPTRDGKKTVDIGGLGNLVSSCSVPSSVLAIQSGNMPGVKSGKAYNISASIGLKLARIGADVSGQYSGTTTLTIEKDAVPSLNFINVNNWILRNRAAFESRCLAWLSKPNVYVIEEAFVVSKGSYSITYKDGATVKVTPGANAPVTASLGVSNSPTGELNIIEPVAFALRQMGQYSSKYGFGLPPASSVGQVTATGIVMPRYPTPLAHAVIRNITTAH